MYCTIPNAPRTTHLSEGVPEGEAGEGARVVEVAEDSLVARVGEALPLVEPATAELPLMTTPEQRELLGELVALDVVELLVGGTAQADAADIERAQAGD